MNCHNFYTFPGYTCTYQVKRYRKMKGDSVMDNHFDPNHHNTNFNSDTRSQENGQQPSEHAVHSENANNSRTETYVVGKELAHGQDRKSTRLNSSPA